MVAYLPWITFFVGILVGWLLTWLILTGGKRDLESRVVQMEEDLQKRDAEMAACLEEIANKTADFKAQIKTLKSDLKTRTNELKTATAEWEACTAELEVLQSQIADLQDKVQAQAVVAAAGTRGDTIKIDLEEPTEVDDFTQITGIGPALAARLSAAGIYRYSELAEADPDELPNALGVQSWQKAEPEVWVAEAAELAERQPQVHVGDDLMLLEGIGPAYAVRLRASGITTFGHLAASDEETLAVIIGAPAWRRANYGDWIMQARLADAGDEAGLKELQDQLFSRQGDNLILIAGVGPQSADVLQTGGINSYAALAAADPEELAALFADADVRAGDFEAWIAEAKLRVAGKRIKRTRTRPADLEILDTRSCPQDLELIDGVGTIYEQRLYEAGVGTFWEAGMLSEDILSEIFEVQEFQDVDLGAIKVDALRLAEETGTMGHVWDGTEPDNFEPLVGIGPVLERRLYAAGICTFEALATSTVELLEKVCHAPAFQHVDYGRWIEQAREQLA